MTNQKVRVLVLEDYDYNRPSANGVKNVIHDFCKYGKEDHDFSIAGFGDKKDLGTWGLHEDHETRFRYFVLATRSGNARRRNLVPDSLRLALGVLRFRKQLKAVGADFIHVHRVELGFLSNVVFRSSKTVQMIHNASRGLAGANSESVWRFFGAAYSVLEKFTVAKSFSVGVFSRDESLRLSLLARKVLRCQTWFNPSTFSPDHRLDISRPFTVAWVGRFEKQKNPILALETMATLQKQGLECQLKIAGSGSLEMRMREYVQTRGIKNISFEGNLSKARLADLYRNSSALLMTSEFEGSPTVLVEALACGLPAVATPESDPDDLIVDGLNGFKVLSGELAERLSWVLERRVIAGSPVAATVIHRRASMLCLQTLQKLHQDLTC